MKVPAPLFTTVFIAVAMLLFTQNNYAQPCTDFDGDGYCSDVDCNDNIAAINPGAPELCDGIDNNCNGLIDDDAIDGPTWYADSDSDGFGDPNASQQVCQQPAGYVNNSLDCNDDDPAINPNAPEICNETDDDCDGSIDEFAIDAPPWYQDADGDGFGNQNVVLAQCDPPEGYVNNLTDCNDTNPAIHPNTLWYADVDGDGYGNPNNTLTTCNAGSNYVLDNTDCNDINPNINPYSPEICDNNVDDNCDTQIDENCGPPLEVYVGTCQVVYYGYAPAECTDLTAEATGGTPPYVFNWSNGMSGPTISVCPTTSTYYTVTVTDATQAEEATNDIEVEVVDVRCGNNNHKVLLCHEPNGNPKTKCIHPDAVPEHMSHGDHLGPCGAMPCSGGAEGLIVFGADGTTEQEAELYWNHLSSRSVSRYEVERSVDGQLFNTILKQNTQGHADGSKQFAGLDHQPEEGANYYRLKVVYDDGTTEFSDIEKVVFQPLVGFLVIPNPASSWIQVFPKNYLGKEIDLVIYNALGKPVFQQHIDEVTDSLIAIDLEELKVNDGLYWITIIHQGRARGKRLVVAKP